GPFVGGAAACRDIARPGVQLISDKFAGVIAEASSNEAERSDLTLLFERSIADGRNAVTGGRMDCRLAERPLADIERSIAGSAPNSLAVVIAPSSAAAAATAPTTSVTPIAVGPPV